MRNVLEMARFELAAAMRTKRAIALVAIYLVTSLFGMSGAITALGKMEAGDIVASREKATAGIADEITRRLAPHGINVTLVNITNIDYSDAFERAVEEKQVALQKSIKEKNETARRL